MDRKTEAFRPHGSAATEDHWLVALRRYLGFMALGNLVWEFAQLPLYAIWAEGTPSAMIRAAIHCSGGDVLVATATLVLALLLAGPGWPIAARPYRNVAALAVIFGFGYLVFSEWLNTAVRGAWAYSNLMPVIPVLGTGLSPALQWIMIPIAAFWWARRAVEAAIQPNERYA